jgi:hypothetical protein
MQACVTHKRLYVEYDAAVSALIEARTRFDYATNQGPVTVYKCEECGFYHLTSQGKMNETLEKYLATGKIKLQKEADRWLDKLKKK